MMRAIFFLLLKDIEKEKINLQIKVIGYEDKVVLVDLLQLKPACKTCNVINLETIFINKKDLQYDSVNISSIKMNQVKFLI